MIEVNRIKIKQVLSQRLADSNWDYLSRYIHEDFDNILNYLINSVNKGKRFTPQIKNVFKAFEECNYDDLKVVMVGQDPYPQFDYSNNRTIADGLAFSCSHTNLEQPSLKFIFDEIQNTIDPDYERLCNLTRWSKQGVLLINTALTTEIGKIGKHYELWKPMLTKLIEFIDIEFGNIVFVFLGKKAQQFSSIINRNTTAVKNHIIHISHPASAAYRNSVWDSNNLFNKINKLLGDRSIIW